MPYVRLSGIYFFYFSALGAFLPYWPLYLEGIGFDPIQIGQIMAIPAATKIVSPNLWGWLADHTGRTLRLIRWAAFSTFVAFCAVFWVRDYAGVVGVMLGFSFFWNAILPLFETITLGHLHGQAQRYSGIRMWGSIGFIAWVAALGKGLDGPFPVACLPQAVALLFGALWLNTLVVPSSGRENHGEGQGSLAGILKRPDVIAFFVANMLLQVAHGPYYVFFSVYLEEHGFDGAGIGQLWALGVFAEIVLFAGFHRLLRLASPRAILLGSLALSAARWLMIAWGVDHLAWLLIAQVLHAASFGAVHAVAIHLVHGYFRGPHHGKGQALYSSLSFGLGGALGSFLSGYGWEDWGPRGVYTAAAGCCLLALGVAWPRVGRSVA
ncbi:MFS transporter, PPP family, 3-phenylpropionic acid transporter [Methylomagnum ishizawai]|uniref:MFS transporter, PPP family, 3-phenylpropionic acid transporter n=1 Tax=Methylomagnum ishizawai TaxID=1760988 RepID=A0A1Y6D494_9GAMM|nr:MFS transporter [Methylomagnum ishizawai]SMF95362.1 MFS transporter, PPP family, 3-phenylpropionic acid transporter [Methylomagnum ishizawai]